MSIKIFMSENEKGKLLRLIFEEHGFDITYLFYGFYTKIQYIEEGFLVSEKIGS
ncbi:MULTISPECIES: hypothetical protein [Clostridium]|uniref:Uncharacterized protein n=1 Tax=Clostridium frigoriphilum TaxID=443253 RepID=A0ABU7UPC8_9CLOT|nr:hypothetical protein [Clostridium sp. DSM 17811]MBU3099318.1 hypothetical protein [Clostridium sp. DSM 17811]